MKRTAIGCAAVVVSIAGTANGQIAPSQAATAVQVNSIISVLQRSGSTPSNACVGALQEMHTTETQLKQLGGDVSELDGSSAVSDSDKAEIEIARDVFSTNIDTARTDCLPDAERTCQTTRDPILTKACADMEHAMAAGATATH